MNGESTSNQPPSTTTPPPTRVDVLCMIWDHVKWIDRFLKSDKSDYNGVHRAKMYDLQTLFSGCKTILCGLKDGELELRVIALEEKLKDGILIEQPGKETKRA